MTKNLNIDVRMTEWLNKKDKIFVLSDPFHELTLNPSLIEDHGPKTRHLFFPSDAIRRD